MVIYPKVHIITCKYCIFRSINKVFYHKLHKKIHKIKKIMHQSVFSQVMDYRVAMRQDLTFAILKPADLGKLASLNFVLSWLANEQQQQFCN